MPHEEWLTLRRQGIGGSDAAAVLGFNPYQSPYSIWASKLGLSKEQDMHDNEPMRQGRDLEGYVASRFCEQEGKRTRRASQMLRHPDFPWMIANIDRRIVGERAGLECKTSKDIHLVRYRNGEYPAEHYCQCLHYLAVTGMDHWYLAVLVFGTGLLVFRIERDEEEIAELIRAERAFWEGHVLTHIPPPIDGHRATKEALGQVFPRARSGYIDCPEPSLLDQYTRVRSDMDELKKIKDQLGNQIRSLICDHEGMGSATHVARWTNTKRTHINGAALARDYPQIDLARYTIVTESRSLYVQEMEESQWTNC